MPIPVADIIRSAATILNDEDHVRWTIPELLDWINQAAGEIVVRRPPAGERTASLTLVDGPLQALPDGGIQLIDVVRNIPGRSISRTSRRLLDDQVPDWYDDKPSLKIKHFTLEIETPKSFYVYPPAKAGAVVEAKFSASPAEVTAEGDTLDMDRIYIGPIVSFTLYRSLAKDSEYANGVIAAAHFQAFNEAIGTSNAMSQDIAANAGSQ